MPLLWAARYGHRSDQIVSEEIVRMLLDNGADVNAQGGKHGNALQAALEKGHLEVV